MTMTLQHRTRKNQKGVVLFVALIFLIILTLLGVSAVETTILETKLAKAQEERNYAFQAAEAGLVTVGNFTTAQLQAVMAVGTDREDDTVVTRQRKAPTKPEPVNFESLATDIQINYLGRFIPQRCGSAASCSSHLRIEWVYFETSSTGIADINNPDVMQISLGNGVRQEAPAQ